MYSIPIVSIYDPCIVATEEMCENLLTADLKLSTMVITPTNQYRVLLVRQLRLPLCITRWSSARTEQLDFINAGFYINLCNALFEAKKTIMQCSDFKSLHHSSVIHPWSALFWIYFEWTFC